jgi:hypothetical protein
MQNNNILTDKICEFFGKNTRQNVQFLFRQNDLEF